MGRLPLSQQTVLLLLLEYSEKCVIHKMPVFEKASVKSL